MKYRLSREDLLDMTNMIVVVIATILVAIAACVFGSVTGCVDRPARNPIKHQPTSTVAPVKSEAPHPNIAPIQTYY